MDWVQVVFLRDPAYDWTALRAGFGVLQDAWKRFQRKHPIPAPHVVVALRTLWNRIRPCTDDLTIAQQLDQMLQAHAAEWDEVVSVVCNEDMQSPGPATPDNAARAPRVTVLDSPEIKQRISEWQTVDLRSPSPRRSAAAQSSWEAPRSEAGQRSLRSDRPRYPNGRPKPTSRTVATSSGVNRKFHKQGLKYGPNTPAAARPMRDLKQISFAELSRWTERQCERWLTQKGLFGKKMVIVVGFAKHR